jgi:Tat protein secretion system quality control protein TatD with DNase activity
MAVLEALSSKVAGAGLERARLLWETDQPHRAIVALQEVQAAFMPKSNKPCHMQSKMYLPVQISGKLAAMRNYCF